MLLQGEKSGVLQVKGLVIEPLGYGHEDTDLLYMVRGDTAPENSPLSGFDRYESIVVGA